MDPAGKRGPNFSIDECIMVLDLYRRIRDDGIPFDNRIENAQLSATLSEMGIVDERSPKSIAKKLHNFRYLDTNGAMGLKNGGYTTDRVWEIYSANDFAKLNKAVEDVISRAKLKKIVTAPEYEEYLYPEGAEREVYEITLDSCSEMYGASEIIGYNKEVLARVREGQNYFRAMVLENFDGKCCITGCGNGKLLRASHIRPWKNCPDGPEKVDFTNGLCLNPLHDVAFDQGLITLTTDLRVELSPRIDEFVNPLTRKKEFDCYDNEKITTPKKALNPKYINYHRNHVFKKVDV